MALYAVQDDDSRGFYTSAEEMMREDTIHIMSVYADGWNKNIKFRGLTTKERDEINKWAGIGDKRDRVKFAARTIEFGMVEPRFNYFNAEQFVRDQNGEDVSSLVDAIWHNNELWRDYMLRVEQMRERKQLEETIEREEPKAPNPEIS